MRTLIVRFFAAEDGAPIEGTASLYAGRWRTAVAAKQKPPRPAAEVEFEVEDATVVNEVLVNAARRFPRHISWPKNDILQVKLEKSSELIIAANHDGPRFVQVHPAGGQDVSFGNGFLGVAAGHSLNCTPILPGPYVIDVFDDTKTPIAQLNVDLGAWRTTFIEVP
ncbi:MAG TPA: hypothetical protein VGQ46_02510 [Thermoanaerobaculia bacterium]|jgi:hypothetical protein|nr:hypothetical protein [Thermoanaerobaculia bacterium]